MAGSRVARRTDRAGAVRGAVQAPKTGDGRDVSQFSQIFRAIENRKTSRPSPVFLCRSYRSSACAVITIANPRHAAIIFMVVHVFRLCGTVIPKYCVTIQKPESLTWENADPPAQRARINSVGEYPGTPFTSGAAIPAAVMMATVAEPCARRMAAAISHTTNSGEIALVISRLPA